MLNSVVFTGNMNLWDAALYVIHNALLSHAFLMVWKNRAGLKPPLSLTTGV